MFSGLGHITPIPIIKAHFFIFFGTTLEIENLKYGFLCIP